MWLFYGVLCTTEQTQVARKTGSECFLAWLQKQIHQPRTGSITVSLRLQVLLSLRADEAEDRSRDFPKLMILLPALGPAPVCALWERWERTVCAGGTLLEDTKMDDNQGSTWAFLSKYQMCMLWSCWSVTMQKWFLPFTSFLDSLRLWLVWQKKILQQIWG